MAITQDKIQKELDAGFNIFCATCVHHHEAKDKGLVSCLQSRTTCGGPLKGKTFPDYQGIIPRDRFKDVCLMCGMPSPYLGVYVAGEHTFSLCHKDRKAIEVLPSLNVTVKPLIVPLRSKP